MKLLVLCFNRGNKKMCQKVGERRFGFHVLDSRCADGFVYFIAVGLVQEYGEDEVSNHVAFNIVTNCDTMKDSVVTITKSVTTPVATTPATSFATAAEFDDSELDCSSDDDDLSFEKYKKHRL
ncbi:hypothetical protein TIFTF001_014623 [Ficus carica]|uniref:Uncharacterized protein n=1 Tax=Ficus carica TaxID=3494 RepID=A0AA87ZX67_FICCA|nr:hypothetical protein TIFTF001_014623 [Ficus carica]